jgi:hypothetical protein
MEKLSDTVWLTVKILVGIFAIRALMLFAGFKEGDVPVVDPIFFAVGNVILSFGNLMARLIGMRFGS